MDASELLGFVGRRIPADQAPGAVPTLAGDRQQFRRFVGVLQTGAMTALSTVDAKWQESADGATGWTDVAGENVACTQLTAAVNANDLVILELPSFVMTKRYCRLLVTVGTTSSFLAVDLIGMRPYTYPASTYNGAWLFERRVAFLPE